MIRVQSVRGIVLVYCTLVTVCAVALAQRDGTEPYAAERQRLVEEILKPEGISDPRVLEAIGKTERHHFVPTKLRAQAYYDRALPIGHEQTISSPFIVALMTEQIQPKPEDKVLEIGTGSGYQAAVLSPLVAQVYTIEIVPELGHHAAQLLKQLDYKNVSVRVGDGYLGWPEHAPFDKIIVTCSPEKVPQPLVDQLREGGRMVIPVGQRYQQTLYLMEKRDGKLVQLETRPTLFVPMTGTAEVQRQVKPDGSHPQLINGNFEAPVEDDRTIPGWYYGRGLHWSTIDAGEGKACIEFENEVSGRPSILLQGLALDGAKVHQVRLAARVRVENIRAGLSPDELPLVSLAFYDEERREISVVWLGPFRKATAWTQVEQTIKVPPRTRECIVRVGLFGATGKAVFDDIQLEAVQP